MLCTGHGFHILDCTLPQLLSAGTRIANIAKELLTFSRKLPQFTCLTQSYAGQTHDNLLNLHVSRVSHFLFYLVKSVVIVRTSENVPIFPFFLSLSLSFSLFILPCFSLENLLPLPLQSGN